MTHADALGWNDGWAEIDVAIVDAAKEDAVGDQFPGVEVVRAIRADQGGGAPVVVVVTGHFLNDGLRHRMAEAGADFFFFRANLRSADAIVDVVCHPERYRRGVPDVGDASRREALGITGQSRLEELVSYVAHHGLQDAFDPDDPKRHEPRSRTWFRHRQAIAEAARIEPVNLTTGFRPHGTQAWPSLRQLRNAYGWAARARRIDDGTAPIKK